MDKVLITEEGYGRRYKELQALHEAGTLTDGILIESIPVFFVPLEGEWDWPHSLGGQWILDNPQEFAQLVPDMGDFLWTHAQYPEVLSLSLVYPDFLRCIPEEHRTEYVAQVFSKFGPWNGRWIASVRSAGIPREQIAQLMIKRFRALADGQAPSESYPLEVLFFFVNGMGLKEYPAPGEALPEDAPWSIFEADSFLEICRAALPLQPRIIFQLRGWLGYKLRSGVVDMLCDEAIARVDTLDDLSLDELRLLPLVTRLSLAQRLRLTDKTHVEVAQFLIEQILFWGKPQGPLLYKKIKPLLDRIDPAVLFSSTWHMRQTSNQRSMVQWLDFPLLTRLTESGYILGEIGQGEYCLKGEKVPKTRFELRFGGCVLIQDEAGSVPDLQIGQRALACVQAAKSVWCENKKSVFTAKFIPLSAVPEST